MEISALAKKSKHSAPPLTKSRSGKELGSEPTPSKEPGVPSKLSCPKTSASLFAIAIALAPVLAAAFIPFALTVGEALSELEEVCARRGRLKDGMLVGPRQQGCAKEYTHARNRDVETLGASKTEEFNKATHAIGPNAPPGLPPG